MITRAQIRRQLRQNGGIMNAVPRQGYFLGSIGSAIGKVVGKVGDVAKKVVKSPVGKAALLGAGLYGLGGGFGSQGFGLGNIGPSIGRGLSAVRSGLFGSVMPNVRAPGMPSFLGETGFTRTGGILGKLGLTKGGGSMMPTALGGMTAASLLTYFMAKGKTEEEAENLAQDVYRGKGLGMDLIKADMKNYRSGILSASQAHDKGYHFLTPRNYLGAQGGRVGLANGGEGVEQMYVSDDLGALPKKGGGVLPEDMGKLKKENFDSEADYKRYLKRLNKKAQGGRIGKYGGGMGTAMPRIPMGMPRVNAGGISELDYRQEGGFVPMGVKEKADDVPAMLSKNEFVMTADAVKAAGGGSVEKGAQRMYDTMKRLEGRVA